MKFLKSAFDGKASLKDNARTAGMNSRMSQYPDAEPFAKRHRAMRNVSERSTGHGVKFDNKVNFDRDV